MHRRNLGRRLLVTLVVLVVAAGAAAAHGPAGTAATPTDPGPTANGTWWMGPHMGPDGGDGTGWHMGPHHWWTGDGTADAGSGYACGGPWTGMMGGAGGWGMGGSGLWGLGFLWPLLFVGLVVGAGSLVVTGRQDAGTDRAHELLRERHAAGEFSEEEYAARRDALRA